MNDPFNCLIRVGSDDGVTDIPYESIKISSKNSEYNILKQNKETSLKRKTSKERTSLEKSKNNSQDLYLIYMLKLKFLFIGSFIFS